jgi:uncharacterized protein (TIGR02466 family)
MVIHQLFPEPVYVSKLERTLTKEELEIVNEYKKKTYKNEGNLTSLDTYVLENKTLKNLKADLNKKIIEYFNEVVCPKNSIIPYITQSWINYTETNQFHHNHSHSNSYISGIFYVNADKEKDQIKFFKPDYYQKIQLDVIKYNPFNSTGWRCSVQTGDVLLFPSNLTHGVTYKKGTNTRISLSFNVFLKGTIGNKKQLSELILE